MFRVHSPVRVKSPFHTTEELLGRMLAQMESLTFSFNTLKRENENKIEEISKLAKKVGCSGEVETDKGTTQRQDVTNDSSSEGEQENRQARDNLRFRSEKNYAEPNVRFSVPLASKHRREGKNKSRNRDRNHSWDQWSRRYRNRFH